MKIAVADDEPGVQAYLEDILGRLGHEVVSVCHTGQELLERCLESPPDLIITDIKMSGLDGIEATRRIHEKLDVPVILVSAYHEPEILERTQEIQVMAYLVKPIRMENVKAAIAVAAGRFSEFQALRKEGADLKQALQDRKTIEKAKGLLMAEAKLSEEDAFRRLQALARSRSRKLVDIAEMLILAREALLPEESGDGDDGRAGR